MVMTSVSGHLLNYEFVGKYKNWHGCSPLELFDAPIQKFCSEDGQKIKVIVYILADLFCFTEFFLEDSGKGNSFLSRFDYMD